MERRIGVFETELYGKTSRKVVWEAVRSDGTIARTWVVDKGWEVFVEWDPSRNLYVMKTDIATRY